MSRHTCTACQIPIDNGHAHIRSVALQQVAFCSPCAEDRGLVDPPVRQSLSVEMAKAGAQLVTEVEAFAARVAS